MRQHEQQMKQKQSNEAIGGGERAKDSGEQVETPAGQVQNGKKGISKEEKVLLEKMRAFRIEPAPGRYVGDKYDLDMTPVKNRAHRSRRRIAAA